MVKIKKIEGFNGYYITDSGKVMSTRNNGFKWLRCKKTGQVTLCVNKEKKEYPYIHRLVALAFIPKPEEYKHIPLEELDVHHKDFNHCNNKVNNLILITSDKHREIHRNSEITRERKSKSMKGRPIPNDIRLKISKSLKGSFNNASSKPVIQYTKNSEFVAEYPSASEAQRLTGISHANIISCCLYKRNSAGGYKWKYAS